MNTLAVDAYLDELLCDVADVAALPAMPGIAMTAPAAAHPAPGPAVVAAPVVAEQPPPASAARQAPADMTRHTSPDASATVPHRLARPSGSGRWLRLGIGRDHYAFELLRVQEVVRVAPIVAMRNAPPAVLGVMNLRGRIVPVFDLGRWLGSADVVESEQSRIVVVERDDELIGVLVTAVEDVATLAREHIEPPLSGSDAGAILGIARIGRSPVVLLDANALFA